MKQETTEEKILQKLRCINDSINSLSNSNILEKITLILVIISIIISISAYNISNSQFQIYKYEKEPKIIFTEVECETPYMGTNSIWITLINYGLPTTYKLNITTTGFKCAYNINRYNSQDYDKYNNTNCSKSYSIGENTHSSSRFSLIPNKTHNGIFRYNIDYEYKTFNGVINKVHIITCEFEKENSSSREKYKLVKQY